MPRVDAGANNVYGPSLSRSDAEKLYRDALAKAVDDAKARADVLAKAAGREVGRVTAMIESGATDAPVFAKEAMAARDSTPVVSGPRRRRPASVSRSSSVDRPPAGIRKRGPCRGGVGAAAASPSLTARRPRRRHRGAAAVAGGATCRGAT